MAVAKKVLSVLGAALLCLVAVQPGHARGGSGGASTASGHATSTNGAVAPSGSGKGTSAKVVRIDVTKSTRDPNATKAAGKAGTSTPKTSKTDPLQSLATTATPNATPQLRSRVPTLESARQFETRTCHAATCFDKHPNGTYMAPVRPPKQIESQAMDWCKKKSGAHGCEI